MDNQEYAYASAPEFFGGAPVETGNTSLISIPNIAPVAVNSANSRAIRKLDRAVEMDSYRESRKRDLMGEAIVNTAGLSELADRAVRIVPSCETPVRQIVNVFAASSAQYIAKKYS